MDTIISTTTLEIMNTDIYKEELLLEDPFATSVDSDGNEIYDAFDQDTDLINENLGWD